MMELDLTTVSAMTALVVIVAGVMFILETMLREDDRVGRAWSVGFLAGILAAVAYVVWNIDPAEGWWATAVGNAAFVASTGFLYLGCRLFNGRDIRWTGILLAVLVSASLLAVAVQGEAGGAWAGAPIMYVSLAVLAACGASECRRGDLRGVRTAIVLTVIFCVEALFFLSRTVVIVVAGETSELFLIWWGTVPTSLLTIVLTIVAVVIASVLRAERAQLRGRRRENPSAVEAGVLNAGSFTQLIDDALPRARDRSESLAVVAIRLTDMRHVATAFGVAEADALAKAWRRSVRRAAATQSWVGEDGEGGLLIGLIGDGDARRAASDIGVQVYSELAAIGASVVPGIEVGTAVDDGEVDAAALIATARAALVDAEGALGDVGDGDQVVSR
ncbi:hypothetical protein [Microbacterium sp. NPDC058345]|uniref:hypothetical protein n=1 Tax=Microbacterium sp. NPDC058345 TaxID=3346455 RepID=UPI00365465E3